MQCIDSIAQFVVLTCKTRKHMLQLCILFQANSDLHQINVNLDIAL
jgi:hypothetical protein